MQRVHRLCVLIAVAALLVPAFADTARAQQWIDGPLVYTNNYNCITGGWESLTGQFVGYYGKTDATFPRVGDVYYGRVVVSTVGNACGGTGVVPEALLPPNTTFAVSATNRIRCFSGPLGGTMTEFTDEINPSGQPFCRQQPLLGTYGYQFLTHLWPLAQGRALEIWFPMVSNARLDGIASNAYLNGYVWASAGLGTGWATPRQGVFVGAAAASGVTYPSPAYQSLTSTSVRLLADITNGTTSGTAYFDWGPTTAYGNTDATSITTTYAAWSVWDDLDSLAPSTTYHWRVRYVTSTGTSYIGADQTFTTLAAPPAGFNKANPANTVTGQPTSVTFSWGAARGAISYEYCVSLSPSCSGSWTNVGTAGSTVRSGLGYSTTYYWQVRARNAAGTTEANGGAWWRFSTGTLPGAFSKDRPSGGATGQPPNVTLAWTASTSATGYEYCVNTSPTCAGGWTSTATATTTTVAGLSASTTYYWQVRARNSTGITEANGGSWWYFGRSTTAPRRTRGDFDGDGKMDPAFWRPSGGTWWGLLSAGNYTSYLAKEWGLGAAGDVPVPGDYDGDGKTDLAFWRPSAGSWWVLLSRLNFTTYLVKEWGSQAAGDIPVPGDYDGDRKTDLAFYRPSAGTWWVLLSGTNYTTYLAKAWGSQAAGDTPVPGDYDGDGKTDLAFYRPSAGTWWILLSGANYTTYMAKAWGVEAAGDTPMPADFDGDGKTDPAFYRPSAGTWWVLLSGGNYTTYLGKEWGSQAAGDKPMPGDFDGDGKADMAFWRPSAGTWWVLLSGGNYTTYLAKQWGTLAAGDVPLTER